MLRFHPDSVYLVYIDSKGGEHSQPACDIVESGTLIDPYTDDDMEVDHVVVI